MPDMPKTIYAREFGDEQRVWRPPADQPWSDETVFVEKAAFDRLLARMVRIAQYSPPEEIREGDPYGEWGVDAGEAIEMAYDNVIEEAKAAITECGVKVDV